MVFRGVQLLFSSRLFLRHSSSFLRASTRLFNLCAPLLLLVLSSGIFGCQTCSLYEFGRTQPANRKSSFHIIPRTLSFVALQ